MILIGDKPTVEDHNVNEWRKIYGGIKFRFQQQTGTTGFFFLLLAAAGGLIRFRFESPTLRKPSTAKQDYLLQQRWGSRSKQWQGCWN